MRWDTTPIILGALALLGGVGKARAELHFPATRVDLGEVRSGARVGHAFPFVNKGPTPVEIVETRPGCGCLRPSLERTLYQPGGQGTLRLEVNTRGESAGAHSWRLQVLYRDGGQVRELLLEVSARVITEVTLQPAALTLMATGPLSQDVLLTDLRAKPLTLRTLTTSSPCLRAHAAERSRDGLGHWIYRIRLEFSGDCAEGRHDEALVLYTDDPEYAELRLPITLLRRPRPRVTASPGDVTLILARGETTAQRRVRLTDAQGSPVAVDRVRCEDPALDCAAEETADGCTLLIRVERSRLQGDSLESTIRVDVRSPVRETLLIPVICTVEGDEP
jgi:hypothetical protein